MGKCYFAFYRKLILLTLFAIITISLVAQTKNISFRITDKNDELVPFASVTVLQKSDTLKFQKKESDKNGVATFSVQENVQYIIRISATGYLPLNKEIMPDSLTVSLVIEPVSKILENVKVISQKPLITQEDDKTIVDAENLAASSTNSYEVIEKTPGLFVDSDGNIYISSLSPATVQINGRDMKMSAADIATILKSLPPNSITKIEIVRTPSAKYDANSSGGIVNVILRTGVKIGLTGSINTGIQQGAYGNQFAGFNLNNNDGKKNSFINLNYSRRNSYERIITERIFAPDSILSQNALTNYPANSYFGRYGIVFPVSKKWDIDFGSSISYNDYDNKTENRNLIQKISSSQTITDSKNFVNNDGSSLNLRIGINGKQKIDSTGSEWSNDIFYNFTRNKSEQIFSNNISIPLMIISGGDGTSNNDRDYINFQSDLKLKMKNRVILETGAKSSILVFKSIADYYKETSGNRIKDQNRTNTFLYNENINAFYLQVSKTLGKDFIIKAGSRLENTNMKGRQIIPSDTSFNIHRTDLFPFIYLSKKVMQIAGYDLRAYLVYRRTINRPVYEQLNPFPRYIDQYLSEAGNPSLRPQFTQNYEANISVNERPILAIGVNDTKDIFTNVIYQSDTSNSQAYRTYDNLGKRKEIYFRGLGAIPPGKKYFFVLGGQYNHNFYQGFYENKPLSYKKGSWVFFTYHSLKLDKRSQISLHGFMRLKGQQQFYELGPFGALNANINRQFIIQKLIITISMTDIFYTNKNSFLINQGSINAKGERFADTQRVGINIRYNFGIRRKEEKKNDFLNIESPERIN